MTLHDTISSQYAAYQMLRDSLKHRFPVYCMDLKKDKVVRRWLLSLVVKVYIDDCRSVRYSSNARRWHGL